jgi:hexulose-6-phosphate isomerase
MLSTKIGIMQGRLSEPIDEKIQAYPAKTWKEEFKIASELGLNSIEWIVEEPLITNALMSKVGIKEVISVIQRNQVRVDFICADIFMERPLYDFSKEGLLEKTKLLNEVVLSAKEVGASCVEIPFVDNSRLNSEEKIKNAIEILNKSLDYADDLDMVLALETDLDPENQVQLIEKINHDALRLNYDIGNSASLGYDPIAELDAYGKLIANVHIKDRVLGGSTVPLGEGSADIPKVLRHLSQIGYQGDFILQAARQSDDVLAAKDYLEQVKKWIAQVNGQ